MRTSSAAAERSDFIRQKKTQLGSLGRRIHELEARTRKLDTETWIKAVSHFEGLKDQHAALQQRVEDAESTPPDDWANIREGIEQAWAELEEALTKRGRSESAPQ